MIYKYPFTATILRAPLGAVLLVGYQGDGSELPTLWIDHDQTAPYTNYFVVGTGQNRPNGAKHVGSAICGRYVWHVYMELPL
jgi:hypothetical protein